MTTAPLTDVKAHPAVLARPWLAVAAAVASGVGVDLMAWGRPIGFGLAAALSAVTLAIWATIRINGPVERTVRLLFVVAVCMAAVPAVRASAVIVGLGILAWAALIGVAVTRNRVGSISDWTMTRYVRAGFAWATAAAEPTRMAAAELNGLATSGAAIARRSLPLLRGLALSWIVLTFFTVLLSAADPIFGGIIADTLDIDLSPDRIIRFAVVAGASSWLVLGLARRAAGDGTPRTEFRPSSVGAVEALLIVGSLNVLFVTFLVVQFAYLFDGEVGRIDLGYAQYARQGFFELVFVAACVLTLILAIDWIVARRIRTLDLLHLGLIVQTLIMTWSAVVRMMAYTNEFGLSELRLYTTAFMAWIAVLMLGAAVTVLRGRRDRFALGAFVTGLVAVVALVAINPDAVIAETNLARTASPHGIDVTYLSTLSADAVPVLAAAATEPELPSATRQQLRAVLDAARVELEDRASLGWRSWSLISSRAHESLASPG